MKSIPEIRKVVYGFRKDTLAEMFIEIIHKSADAEHVLQRLKFHDTVNDYSAKVDKANKLAAEFYKLSDKAKRQAKNQRKLQQLLELRNHLQKHPGAKIVEEMLNEIPA